MSIPLNGATASSAGGDPVSRAVDRKDNLQSNLQMDQTMASIMAARSTRTKPMPKNPTRVIGSNG